MEIWTAFLLGLLGSLHCAGMCGPLVLALPARRVARSAEILGRVVYNLGRIATYGLLGALGGLVGEGFTVAGLARWASIVAGLAILAGLVICSRHGWAMPVARTTTWLRSRFAAVLRHPGYGATFALGALNGFLPCGLVYVACAAAIATGGLGSALGYLLAFGLGTLPMMLGLGLVGKPLQAFLRVRFQPLIPIGLGLLGLLLILRGLSLGVPYLSPDFTAPPGPRPACHY